MLEEAKQICPTTTRRLVGEGALLVDVRERTEVARTAFDVPAIVNIPLSELEQRWSELPKDRDLVMVCEVGARSLKAAYFMQYHGYTRVSNMEDGLLKWMRKGFPVIGERYEEPAAATASSCCGDNAAPEPAASACCGSAATAQEATASATGYCGSVAAQSTKAGCC
ncbi:MAG: hydrolase [Acidovorax sp. SCN 65-28]|uniref:rhodanese-like domain-containing protein n=1 Tax=Acidovorax sp. NO-1 TaxID=512030 RepID=UPI00023FC564|nr:rhodanese-like domain-containing protein [Acidovorax sp. NO-1]EHL22928.1 putative transferase/hydrolase [Acidovorax sp. NO-1]ODS67820.1 MAG: hydrolase [Acidovorax sp. SCN 65-28]